MKESEFFAKLEKFFNENGIIMKPYVEMNTQFTVNPNEKYDEAKYTVTNVKLQFVHRFDP